jgi:phosphatidylserine/phosphatidylglycerophosphate/cardiolipin synthase-like enzyme
MPPVNSMRHSPTIGATMLTTETTMTLYETPPDRVQLLNDIVAAIDGARTSVHVIIYALTETSIVAALLHAAHRGIAVRLILDQSQSAGHAEAPVVAEIIAALGVGDIEIGHSTMGQIIHMKMILIDAEADVPDAQFPTWQDARRAGYPLTIEGSFNLSKSAGDEMNTCLFLPGKALAASMLAVFDAQWDYMAAKTA